MNKLSRKDIAMLEVLAVTEKSKGKLAEYIQQREKAAKAYKAFREAVVNGVEVEKVEKVVEVKRKFKTGDKVRVTSVASDVATTIWLSVGDVAEVIAYKNDLPEDWPFIGRRPVIVTGGRSRCAYFEESALELVEEKSTNEQRAEIIQRAKDALSAWKWENNLRHDGYRNLELPKPYHNWIMVAEFVVNAKKRTVVALLRGYETFELATKGIAKCSPGDVFNEHIGKAIALGRALGKDVSEFENAVQPDKEVIGTVLRATFNYKDGFSISDSVIWNDTDAIYGECVE